jgi:polyhydroxybutyrate depolymerase
VRVHIPQRLRADAPLVVDLHPTGNNAELEAQRTRFEQLSEQEGFVVMTPDGAIPAAPGVWAWNVPGVPLIGDQYPAAGARDDIAFLAEAMSQVGSLARTDRHRTYMVGISGGARMASAFACARPGLVAAIAPVAGLRAGRASAAMPSVPEHGDCSPEKPVAVVSFHGEADTTNPYEGDTDLRWGYSVPVAAQTWARLNGCRQDPSSRSVTASVRLVTYSSCASEAEVWLYVVSRGTHSWPGSTMDPGATQEVDATDLIWRFFERHRRS